MPRVRPAWSLRGESCRALSRMCGLRSQLAPADRGEDGHEHRIEQEAPERRGQPGIDVIPRPQRQRDGLREPDAVLVATRDYRAASDEFGRFLTECCILEHSAWAATAALRAEYERWCDEQGLRPLLGNRFTDRLRDHGCADEKLGGKRGWRGVGLWER